MKLRWIRFTRPVAIPTITAETVRAEHVASLDVDDTRTTVTITLKTGEVFLAPWVTVSMAEVERVKVDDTLAAIEREKKRVPPREGESFAEWQQRAAGTLTVQTGFKRGPGRPRKTEPQP